MEYSIEKGCITDLIRCKENNVIIANCFICYDNLGNDEQFISCNICFKNIDQNKIDYFYKKIEEKIKKAIYDKLKKLECWKSGTNAYAILYDINNKLIGNISNRSMPISISILPYYSDESG